MGKKSKGSRADFGGAWKQTLDWYLDPFEYRACKLLDFPDAQLERENNPVSIVIAAHRAAQRIEFRREVIEYEASKHMPYITSIEEMGWQEGRQQGLREGVITALEIRFGPAPDLIRRSIESVQDEARLRSFHRIAIQAASLEAFARELEG